MAIETPFPGRRWSFRALLLALVVGGVASCGVGDVEETAFVYGMMGPEGGTATVGAITLVIPPGALTEPTAISVFPETADFPIVPPPDDLATYQLLQGYQWCCGPSGTRLLLDALLTVDYGGVLTPQAVTDENVVLLLWDHDLEALVPASVGQDPDANVFTDPHYRRLGHVALGVRTSEPPPPPEFVFTAYLDDQRLALRTPGTEAVDGPLTSGLYLASADGSTDFLHLATDEEVPASFLPSPDGSRILSDVYEYGGEGYGNRLLYGVTKEDLVPTLLAGDEEMIEGSSAVLGWMRDGLRAYFPLWLPDDDLHAFATVPGDGTGAASYLYELADYAWIRDVRQSADGELVLIRYFGPSEEEVIDVFDADTGAPVSQGLIPLNGTWITPRFLPDSTGVYLVDSDREAVDRYAPDGTGPTLLFEPPAEHGFLKDFVLAPNGDDFAYITLVSQSDALHVGSLSGGVRASVDLGRSAYDYSEVIFHPDGAYVYVDAADDDVRVFAASDGTESPALPIAGVGEMDVSQVDGRLLVVLGQRQISVLVGPDAPVAAFGPPGVYVCLPDGSEATQVELPESLSVGAARWLRSTRLAPCMNGFDRFR